MPKGVVAVIAFVSGCLATAVFMLIGGLWEKEPVKYKDAVKIVVAKEALPLGTLITRKALTVAKFPDKCQGSENVLPKQIDQIVGTQVVVPIAKGRPVTVLHLRRATRMPGPGGRSGPIPLPR